MDGAYVAVVAGLAVGIVFVALFAANFGSPNPILQRKLHSELSIEDLRTSYSVDEKIDFVIRATGYGSDCGSPIVQVVRALSNETIRTIDNPVDINCDPTPHNLDKEWNLTELGVKEPLTINKIGYYKIRTSFGGHAVEKYFVVNTDIQHAIAKTNDLDEVKSFVSYYAGANTTVYFVTTCATPQQQGCGTLVRVPSIVEYSYTPPVGDNGSKVATLRIHLEEIWDGKPHSIQVSCQLAGTEASSGLYGSNIEAQEIISFLQKEPSCP
jgi:hypothetical protein